MLKQNQTKMNEFILLGISDDAEQQIPLFFLFALIYIFTLLGNFVIITVIYLSPQLHNPMYFFLCNLSFIDLSSASITQPKLLSMLLLRENTISYGGCIAQLYSFMLFTGTEFFSLTAMAYDRYVAICKPLRYHILMNNTICVRITSTCWVLGMVDPLPHTVLISQLSFCGSHVINHFFCDMSVVLKLSCVDTSFIESMTYLFGLLVEFPVFLLLVISYCCILCAILKIHSAKDRSKAFSTCSSHLIVVILFYGTVWIMYLRPLSQYSADHSKPFSLLYTAIIPLVNPFIYTLRNRDVRNSIFRTSIVQID
ncbi:olfactory receptor 5V1-like [Xenopus tropicalis]|uniref:Olfactory receptor n=1 Tax=Xenopus tropicalis TaxID=8364 RepID=A0A6I8PWV9_XENTR|nr:olfactory receptor 5V1-like [Xenopus tropicalis]